MDKNRCIKTIDFWLKTASAGRLHPRDLAPEVDLKSKEIVDIVGPRRCGKSALLRLLVQRLGLKENYLFVNFEDPFFIEHNSAQAIENLIEVYLEHFSPRLKYLFFDEIQNIQNWEKAVRKLRDGGKYKIFVTGSSSSLLSRELSSLLTGRHISYRLLPLSFPEFLAFKGRAILNARDFAVGQAAISRLLGEYLKLGGFPEAVLTGNVALLKQYFYDMINRDIIGQHDIRHRAAIERMGVYLLSNSGSLLSLSSLKQVLGLSYEVTSAYLDYFMDAFLVFELPQFSYSLKTQSKALKKIYSADPGLAGAVSFKFSENRGRALENAVYLDLIRHGDQAYYYKTKNNHEVDFYLKPVQKSQARLIQVRETLEDPKTKNRELRALEEAMRETGLRRGLVLTGDETGTHKTKDGVIKIMPVYRWLLRGVVPDYEG